jgi:hypothetical protein
MKHSTIQHSKKYKSNVTETRELEESETLKKEKRESKVERNRLWSERKQAGALPERRTD